MSDKFRRIGAWIGIVALLGIYVVTLVSAILQKESTGGLFVASLFCTFVIPVWVFVLQAIYNRTHKDAVGKAEIKKWPVKGTLRTELWRTKRKVQNRNCFEKIWNEKQPYAVLHTAVALCE